MTRNRCRDGDPINAFSLFETEEGFNDVSIFRRKQKIHNCGGGAIEGNQNVRNFDRFFEHYHALLGHLVIGKEENFDNIIAKCQPITPQKYPHNGQQHERDGAVPDRIRKLLLE